MTIKTAALLVVSSLIALGQATWPPINTWHNFSMGMTFYQWAGGNATDITVIPDFSATMLVDSLKSRMAVYFKHRYDLFGIIEGVELIDFANQIWKRQVPFTQSCQQEDLGLPMNFTKFISDLFDPNKTTTVYDVNGTHTFDT